MSQSGRAYIPLKNQEFVDGEYTIVPIRDEDKYLIMQWRNEQIYHLRQNKPLEKEEQERYFEQTVAGLFGQNSPNQLLFSYLKNGECLGYGGLVHINWNDLHAEISFIMDTRLEQEFFTENWSQYLKLIEKLAFEDLGFHKIFVYAFDLRPNLYSALESSGYFQDARLKDHCYFQTRFIDVVIHSKINQQ